MKSILCLALVAVVVISVEGRAQPKQRVPLSALKTKHIRIPRPDQTTVVDLLRSLAELLNIQELYDRVFELIDSGNVDMCELFLWATGRPPNNDERFLELVARLRANEDFLQIIADLEAEGADIGMLTDALEALLNYDPAGCGGKLKPFLSLPDLGAAFEDLYPTIEEVIAWVTANIGTADFQELVDRIAGTDNPVYRLLKTAVADELIIEIVDFFESQGYTRLEVLIQLLSDALGLGWDFN